MRKFEFILWVTNAFIHVLSFASGNPVSWFSYFTSTFCLLLHLWIEVKEETYKIKMRVLTEQLVKHLDSIRNSD